LTTTRVQIDYRKTTKRLQADYTTTTERLHYNGETRMLIRNALEELPITTKAKRLRALWPLIERKLLAGTSHADILRALNDAGFNLTERTYKTYLHRFRKRQRTKGWHQESAASPGAPASNTRPVAVGLPPIPSTDLAKRPATFDFDPRGIPDLLK
jgi:hypothetical protein